LQSSVRTEECSGSEHSKIPWYWRPIDLFDRTEAEAQRRFRAESTVGRYARGDTIFFADDAADRVFYLDRGMAKIEHLSATGQTSIFWFCVPGDLFGAGGISGARWQSVYAKALEQSEVLILPRRRFEKLILDHPQLGLNVIRFLSARLRLACDSMAEVGQRASLRVGRVILRIAESCGRWNADGEVELMARISHQEIADMAGCTRQTVNEVLQILSRRGILRIERRVVHIRDIEHLRMIVEIAEGQEGASLIPD
jgi:CRP-like cAMP-binding protein